MVKEESFTSVVKNEIVSATFIKEQLRSILSAFSKINGKLFINNNHDSLVLKTENAKIAKFLFVSFQTLFNISPRFAYLKNMKLRKSIIYNVIVEQKVSEILDNLEMFNFTNSHPSFVKNEETIRAYITGTFLANGSVNSPLNSNYHLEMAFSDENMAKYILSLMTKNKLMAFTPKIIKRRNQHVVYLKKGEQIATFLALIYASYACLEYENIRINRDYLNNSNRLQICTDANMFRTVKSAQKQIEILEYIDKKIGIKNIPNEKMRELAKLRLQNESASMYELSQMLSDNLKISCSKSSVNHLFRSLKEYAEKLHKGGLK